MTKRVAVTSSVSAAMTAGTGLRPGTNRIFVDPTGPRESCSVGPCAGARLFANGDLGPPHTPATYTTHGVFVSNNSGATWTSIQSNLPANVDITDMDYEISNGSLVVDCSPGEVTKKV